LSDVLAAPSNYLDDVQMGPIAEQLIDPRKTERFQLKAQRVAHKIYGIDQVQEGAVMQLYTALKLPIALQGALMPDAHQGYGLPIGGVLAVENAVIPYGVGNDIGCRMSLSIYDYPVKRLGGEGERFKKMLMENTRFGGSDTFDRRLEAEVMDDPAFDEVMTLKNWKSLAYKQLGTSGSGNHFVEFGVVEIKEPIREYNLEAGTYLGILAHSGSRGFGAKIAKHYTTLAMKQCPLPKEAKHLAWFDLDRQEGMEYWMAMTLAGDYASANHHQIHRRLSKALGEKPLAIIENHHNFAWREQLEDGTEVIVHRKGATPAGKGVLGIIPGSMATHGFIVRGKGEPASINSASHGAGRAMSRKEATQTFTKSSMKKFLKAQGVELIGGGVDEAPQAYKDIYTVMEQQRDLVEVLGTFFPRIVRMDE